MRMTSPDKNRRLCHKSDGLDVIRWRVLESLAKRSRPGPHLLVKPTKDLRLSAIAFFFSVFLQSPGVAGVSSSRPRIAGFWHRGLEDEPPATQGQEHSKEKRFSDVNR